MMVMQEGGVAPIRSAHSPTLRGPAVAGWQNFRIKNFAFLSPADKYRGFGETGFFCSGALARCEMTCEVYKNT